MTRAFKLLPELDPRAHVAEAGRWCLRARNPIPISLGLGITPPTPILHSPRSESPGGVLYATIVPSRGRRRMLCPKWAVSNSGQVHHLPFPSPHRSSPPAKHRSCKLYYKVRRRTEDVLPHRLGYPTPGQARDMPRRNQYSTADLVRVPARTRSRTPRLLCKDVKPQKCGLPCQHCASGSQRRVVGLTTRGRGCIGCQRPDGSKPA